MHCRYDALSTVFGKLRRYCGQYINGMILKKQSEFHIYSECQIFYFFRCVLSSLLPLRSAGRSNFDKSLHNLITLIKKRHKIMIEMKLLCIYKTLIESFSVLFITIQYAVFRISSKTIAYHYIYIFDYYSAYLI